MTKSEFITHLQVRFSDDSENALYTKDEIAVMVEAMARTIAEGLRRDGVVRTPLGVFKVVKRKSRRIRDISSGNIRTLPERKQIVFKPTSKLWGNK